MIFNDWYDPWSNWIMRVNANGLRVILLHHLVTTNDLGVNVDLDMAIQNSVLNTSIVNTGDMRFDLCTFVSQKYWLYGINLC